MLAESSVLVSKALLIKLFVCEEYAIWDSSSLIIDGIYFLLFCSMTDFTCSFSSSSSLQKLQPINQLYNIIYIPHEDYMER
jgi:hypothetical protein